MQYICTCGAVRREVSAGKQIEQDGILVGIVWERVPADEMRDDRQYACLSCGRTVRRGSVIHEESRHQRPA